MPPLVPSPLGCCLVRALSTLFLTPISPPPVYTHNRARVGRREGRGTTTLRRGRNRPSSRELTEHRGEGEEGREGEEAREGEGAAGEACLRGGAHTHKGKVRVQAGLLYAPLTAAVADTVAGAVLLALPLHRHTETDTVWAVGGIGRGTERENEIGIGTGTGRGKGRGKERGRGIGTGRGSENGRGRGSGD